MHKINKKSPTVVAVGSCAGFLLLGPWKSLVCEPVDDSSYSRRRSVAAVLSPSTASSP